MNHGKDFGECDFQQESGSGHQENTRIKRIAKIHHLHRKASSISNQLKPRKNSSNVTFYLDRNENAYTLTDLVLGVTLAEDVAFYTAGCFDLDFSCGFTVKNSTLGRT